MCYKIERNNVDVPSLALYDGPDDEDEDLYFMIEESEDRNGTLSSSSSDSSYNECSSDKDGSESDSKHSDSSNHISMEEVQRLGSASPDQPMDIEKQIHGDPLLIPDLPIRESPLVNYAASHNKWYIRAILDRKSTRLNSSHTVLSRMPSSA